MTSKHADKVRLEVDASDLVNLVANHSGQSGVTTGWAGETGMTLTAVTNPTRGAETLVGTYTGGKCIKVNTVGAVATAKMRGPSVSIDPWGWVGVTVSFADSRVITPGALLTVRLGVELLDGGGSVISFSSTSVVLSEGDDPWQMHEITKVTWAGSGGVSARAYLQFLDGGSVATSRDLYVAKLMMVKAPTQAEVQDVPFADAAWQNVLGSATSAKLTRGGRVSGVLDQVEPGMLTATVVDPIMDPAQNPRMRKGRLCRLTALNSSGLWAPLFTGRVASLDVDYATDKTDPGARPSVTLTAFDAVTELAKTSQPFNYSGNYGPKVKALMAASSVPYVAESGSASTTIVHKEDIGRLWDQLELARNTFPGAQLWVDQSGTLNALEVTPGSPGLSFSDGLVKLVNLSGNPSFETSTSGFKVNTSAAGAAHTESLSTAWAVDGASSLLVTRTTSASASIYLGYVQVTGADGNAGDGLVPAVVGDWLAFTITIKAVVAATWTLWFGQRNATGTTNVHASIGSGVALSAGQVYTFSGVLQVTEASAVTAGFYLRSNFMSTSGVVDIVRVDAVAQYNTGSRQWTGTVPFYAVPTLTQIGLGDATPYTGIDVRFGSGALANELMIVTHNSAEPDGSKEYGPYVNDDSRDDWGVAPATVDLIDATPSAAAAGYLQMFAVPSIFPRSLTFRWADQADDAVFADLYDECRVLHGPTATDLVVPVIGVEHVITPKRWDVTLSFRPRASAAAVTVTNPAAGADTGPDDVAGAPTYVSSGSVLTALTNWTVNSQSFIRVGSLVMWTATITYSGTTRTVPANGDVANLDVASMDSGWWPHLVQAFSVTTGGPLVGGYVHTSGVLAIGPVAPGTSFASGAAWSVGGVYAIKKG